MDPFVDAVMPSSQVDKSTSVQKKTHNPSDVQACTDRGLLSHARQNSEVNLKQVVLEMEKRIMRMEAMLSRIYNTLC